MLGMPAGEGTKAEASRVVATLECARMEANEISLLYSREIHLQCHSRKDFNLPSAQGWISAQPFILRRKLSATIGTTPFKALYGRYCRSPVC
ncbi:uncharacterized protein E5676_scaffold1333G00060 [Cucumis melo var. makuwa]|uniref:Uncharacterized protein n=1 Tax=Cucumis melo var. makuwa TaxID=1194695 RepID=A0A5D3BLP4_CUCMM|nr:uncharacterized protein E6C27_scaffold376G00150 [Cucumis melo var. makuwa]TYK00194.1 uncharacterized protein E5676_scaffold1333G00060 [Cucumis melo var. makuwa]